LRGYAPEARDNRAGLVGAISLRKGQLELDRGQWVEALRGAGPGAGAGVNVPGKPKDVGE